MRKLTELPTALIGAERWQLFLESVCCIPFIEVSYIWGNPYMFWDEVKGNHVEATNHVLRYIVRLFFPRVVAI